MVLSQILATFLLLQQPAQEPASKLPIPFNLGREEKKAGNPLAGYVQMLNQEKAYQEDEMMRSTYWQARSTVASYLGDYWDADKSWDIAFQFDSPKRVYKGPLLRGKHPEDALTYIVRNADKHRWIMFGEEHVKPQTRSIMIPMLRALWKKGFRTFAAETFNEDVQQIADKSGFPTQEIGTYTADPIFAAGVREAIRLGYKLVPYESFAAPPKGPDNDPEFAQNYRERKQAENLKARIFDKDPNAKVIVWAGRAHIYEKSDKGPNGAEWKPMAHVFRQITGQDPLTVYLATYFEHSQRSSERPEYIWATDRGLVKKPVVFVDKSGTPFGEPFDAQAFYPRTTMVEGRPDWMMREMGRKPLPIPPSLVQTEGIQLAQAFGKGEPATAIAIDQVLIRPGEPVPSLMLPKGELWVRVLTADGKETGRVEITN